MNKDKRHAGILMLGIFLALSAFPFFSSQAKAAAADEPVKITCFENGEDNAGQWLIRQWSENEEITVRPATNPISFLPFLKEFHSVKNTVRFIQIIETENIRQPKEHLYLLNSCFTI